MNRVRLLPEQVANQIAAGEVIERPASVIKELVENSLDAGATRVSIEIQAGGRSVMRVTDDGVGMSRDDALLCLERHATSKIRRAEDLAAIQTMGFRGEALPSIASVSRFTLTTRERDSDSPEGTQVSIAGGKILEVKAAGSAPGTSIEVRQLFFNLPARRKFLRSEETEAAHIQHYVLLAALAFPEVAFTFLKDGRTVWQLPPVRSGPEVTARLAALRERLRGLYGDEQRLLPLSFCTEIGGYDAAGVIDFRATRDEARAPQFRLWGFIGAPGVSRSTREDQHVFVNRRPVENRGLNYALLEGYHTALMKGRYPVCCLFLELDPAAVDVNIHPAKREVKFHREAEVRRLVAQGVREALLAFHTGAPALTHPGVAASAKTANTRLPTPIPVEEATRVSQQKVLTNLLSQVSPPEEPEPAHPAQPALPMGFSPAQPAAPRDVVAQPPKYKPPATPAQGPDLPTAPAAPKPFQPATAAIPLLTVPLRLVGVIGNLYVLFESDRGLVLLDQHAAHERVLFEQMLTRLEQSGQAPSQRLLLPDTIELSARDAAFLRQQLPALTRLGVGLSDFGERTFLLDALPPFVKASDPRRFVLELVDELKAVGQSVNTLRLGEHVVAKTVCRHAVKANDPLAGPELENLVEDLRRCAMPYTCPHGRPTLIEMSYRELEKKFGRVQ
jgi:DNA mismatch repair protein MutL